MNENHGSADTDIELIRLSIGEAAPVDSDCIGIDTVKGGFRLTGSLLTGAESNAIIGGPVYDSREAAEAAGIAWAAGCGVTRLYVAFESPGPV